MVRRNDIHWVSDLNQFDRKADWFSDIQSNTKEDLVKGLNTENSNQSQMAENPPVLEITLHAPNSLIVEEIKNENWEVLFQAEDWLHYMIDYPYNQYKWVWKTVYNIQDHSWKNLVKLKGYSNDQDGSFKKCRVLNIKSWNHLDFDSVKWWWVILTWDYIRYFYSWNHSTLYNSDWVKIGMQDYRDNKVTSSFGDSYIQFTNNEWLKQLINVSNWIFSQWFISMIDNTPKQRDDWSKYVLVQDSSWEWSVELDLL